MQTKTEYCRVCKCKLEYEWMKVMGTCAWCVNDFEKYENPATFENYEFGTDDDDEGNLNGGE